MDKVDRLTRLNPAQREDYDAFMLTAKGVTAWRLAWALNRLTPGVDWRKCSKSMMAFEWSRRDDQFGDYRLRSVTLARLAKVLADVNNQ